MMRVSVIMSVCSWPDPRNPAGEPHKFLTRALDSLVAARFPDGAKAADVPDAPDLEILVGIDGQRTQVWNAVFRHVIGPMRERFGEMIPLYQNWKTVGSIAGNDFCRPDWRGVRVRLYGCPESFKWGNPQRNLLLPEVQGDLCWLTDQDDAAFPDALRQACIVAAEHPGCPIVGKMRVWQHGSHSGVNDPPDVLWKTKGRVEQGHFGGHMLIAPNVQECLGRFVPEEKYEADFSYIKATLDAFAERGFHAVWTDGFLADVRPWTRKEYQW